jgi:hypothetical protein
MHPSNPAPTRYPRPTSNARPTNGARRGRSRWFLLVAMLAMFGLVAAACSDSSDDDSGSTTSEATDDTTDTTDSDTTTTTDGGSGTSTPVELTPTELSAGPETLTPTVCEIGGYEFISDSSSSVVPNLQVVSDKLYATDGEGNVVRFDMDLSDGCTLTLDETWGTDGTFLDDDDTGAELLSGSDSGRLVSSDGIFLATVHDVDLDQSFACEAASYVEIDPSGDRGISFFTGSDPELVTFTDSACSVDALPYTAPWGSLYTAFWLDGGTLIVGGTFEDDETVGLMAVDDTGSVLWTQGSGDFSADDAYGWVHGISTCGDRLCAIDTNFNAIHVVDTDGTHVVAFDLVDLLGESGWWTDITPTGDGRAFMATGITRADDDDTADGFIVLLDV